MKEIRVYVVNEDITEDRNLIEQEDFINEAERQGLVFSLQGFVEAFNNGLINSNTDIIHII